MSQAASAIVFTKRSSFASFDKGAVRGLGMRRRRWLNEDAPKFHRSDCASFEK